MASSRDKRFEQYSHEPNRKYFPLQVVSNWLLHQSTFFLLRLGHWRILDTESIHL